MLHRLKKQNEANLCATLWLHNSTCFMALSAFALIIV